MEISALSGMAAKASAHVRLGRLGGSSQKRLVDGAPARTRRSDRNQAMAQTHELAGVPQPDFFIIIGPEDRIQNQLRQEKPAQAPPSVVKCGRGALHIFASGQPYEAVSK